MSLKTPVPLSGAFAVAAACALGCGDYVGSPPPDDRPGQLGRGRFEYYCVGDDDPACDEGETRGDFPGSFAVGGKFRLEFAWKDPADADEPLPELQAAAPSRLARKGEVFTALAAGFSSVLAVHGNSEVADFINLHAAEPASVRVERDGLGVDAVQLAVGEELELRARVRDVDGVQLAGSLSYTWALADEAVAALEGSGRGRVRVRGVAPGVVTLSVVHAGVSAELQVEVTGAEGTSTSSTGTTGDTTDATDTSATDTSATGTSDTTGGDTSSGTSTGGAT